MFILAICPILMAIHKLFSTILLIQTYHTTCVSLRVSLYIDKVHFKSSPLLVITFEMGC